MGGGERGELKDGLVHPLRRGVKRFLNGWRSEALSACFGLFQAVLEGGKVADGVEEDAEEDDPDLDVEVREEAEDECEWAAGLGHDPPGVLVEVGEQEEEAGQDDEAGRDPEEGGGDGLIDAAAGAIEDLCEAADGGAAKHDLFVAGDEDLFLDAAESAAGGGASAALGDPLEESAVLGSDIGLGNLGEVGIGHELDHGAVQGHEGASDAHELPVGGKLVSGRNSGQLVGDVEDGALRVGKVADGGPGVPVFHDANQFFLELGEDAGGDAALEEEVEIGGLGVLAGDEGVDEVLVNPEEITVQEADAPEVDEGEPVFPKEDDIAGVEIAVEELVLVELAIDGEDESPADLSGVDLVDAAPLGDFFGLSTKDFEVIGHEDAAHEFHDEDALGGVSAEDLGDMDLVAAERFFHAAEIGGLVPVIDLLLHDPLDFPDELVPAHIGHDGEPLEQPEEGPHQDHVAPKDAFQMGPLDFDGDENAAGPKGGAVDLSGGSRREGETIKREKEEIEGPAELLLEDTGGRVGREAPRTVGELHQFVADFEGEDVGAHGEELARLDPEDAHFFAELSGFPADVAVAGPAGEEAEEEQPEDARGESGKMPGDERDAESRGPRMLVNPDGWKAGGIDERGGRESLVEQPRAGSGRRLPRGSVPSRFRQAAG